ncbi:hypothetical protein ASF69_01785 [Rhizobium sp. Leaf311]|uniref:hypothetical protein n=1 Tax=Rhizobium sp. Leaf311 TaxID=1736332 RepID=UPI0007159567|nr:hypothetical protein [Rhizobium sp. Leaf311]KQQ61181.1 hypothetical protein ASF69_01785 [Rhizobium sp. Leaf311]
MTDVIELFKKSYSDVYRPDEGQHARDLEIRPGWIEIIEEYCDQLRQWHADGWSINLRWAKEKFGALRIFTDDNRYHMTPLQLYWLDRAGERARRKSLRICQECGQPGRLRWGHRVATVCDLHVQNIGGLRAEDGLIIDADRQSIQADGTMKDWPVERGGVYAMTDAELGLDEGQSMDFAKQMEMQFRPFLALDLRLDGTDTELLDLRRKLLAVDAAIGRYHEVKFQLRSKGYEIAIEHPRSHATIDEIKRDAIIAEIEMIMRGEQS